MSNNPVVVSVGVDIERTDRLSLAATPLVCTDTERQWVTAARRPEARLSVLFSVKEAVYKALSPLGCAREPLFHDAIVTMAHGRVHLRIHDELLPPGHTVQARAELIHDFHVVTSVAVTRVSRTHQESGGVNLGGNSLPA